MRHFKTTKEEFMKSKYVTCEKCGIILDEKTYLMIEMMKRMKDNKRKSR